jgi:O-antigen/teichoic acid export membrane protein
MDLSRTSFLLFLSKGGRALLLFVALTFFTHYLSPTQMGVFFLFFALQGLLSIPADMGIRGALEKRLSEGGAQGEVLSSALVIKLCLLVSVGICVFAARRYVNAYLGADLAVFLVLALILRELSLFYIHAIRGDLQVGKTAPIAFVQRLTWVVVGGILITKGFGVRGLVFGLISGSTVALIITYVTCGVAVGRPSLEHARSLVAFSKYDMISAIGGRIYQWMDTVIIGFFLAQRYVSAYEVAWQVTLLVLLISKPIALTLFPHISNRQAVSSTDQIGATVSKALGFATFVSVPAVVGAAIYAPAILHYLFGAEYIIAATVLVVLMIEKLFQSLNDVIYTSVRAIDRPDLAAKATVASVCLNLVLSPTLLLTIGFVGVAIATTLSWLLNTSLHMYYLSRHVPVVIPYRLIGWYVVASVCMGGVLLGVKAFVPVTGVVVLVTEICLGGLIYAASAVMIPAVRNRIVVPGLRSFGVQRGQ